MGSTRETRTWAEQETRRRAAEHGVAAPVDLGPPERYDDEYTPTETLLSLRPDADPEATGPRSQSVRAVICGRCAGWERPPTPDEVYDAMRATKRTARQRSAIGVLTQEADFEELLKKLARRWPKNRPSRNRPEACGKGPAVVVRGGNAAGTRRRPDRRATSASNRRIAVVSPRGPSRSP